MKVLKCECGEVMQKVEYATAQTTEIGINQLARHMAEQHLLPVIEEYLIAADKARVEHKLSLDDMIAATIVHCHGCKEAMISDTNLYKRVNNRMVAFCSKRCMLL